MKKRILLADGDDSVRKMVGRVLESEDYDVLLAVSGWEAVNKALAGSLDLMLFDADMLERDGRQCFDLIHRIRPLVRVIGMSVKRSQDELGRSDEIDVFMEKPLDPGVLLNTIRSLLDQKLPETAKQIDHPSQPPHCATYTA